ncbi:MAG: hypothetical protein U0R72_03795 [Nakamurella multipartita]
MNLPGETAPDHGAGEGDPSPSELADQARRRRRLDEIFGDVLPETTGDERRSGRPADQDHWYLENRPPHHG